MIKEIEEKDFDLEVLKEDGKVLVDFYANWCGPCKMIRPILEELASLKGTKFVSINVDECDELTEKYGIISIPCLIIFEKGKEINRSIGLKSKAELEELNDI
jgi:thioredoxin 1